MSLSTNTMLLGLGFLIYDAGFNRWSTLLSMVGFGLLALGYLGSFYTFLTDFEE